MYTLFYAKKKKKIYRSLILERFLFEIKSAWILFQRPAIRIYKNNKNSNNREARDGRASPK